MAQRLLSGVAFLGVAALTAGAFVLSYDDIRELALAGMGGRSDRYAWVYPAMYDALVVTGLLAVFVARNAHWFTRAVRWGLLLLLIAGAMTISVQRSVKGFGPIEGDGLDAGVASAPWVAALLAIWLWMSMFRQLRTAAQARTAARRGRGSRRAPAHARTDPSEMIPGFQAEIREEQEPAEFRVPYEVQTSPDPLFPEGAAVPAPRAEPVAEPVAEPEPVREEKGGRSWFGRKKAQDVPAEEPEEVIEPEPEPEAYEEEEGERPPDPFVGVREIPRRPGVAPAMDTVEDFPTDDLYRDPPPPRPMDDPEPERDPYTDTVEDALPRPPILLPTDVKLVGRSQDTQPDFPAPGDDQADDRAEDPDAGDDWAAYAPEWNPPSGTLRSGPVPPEET
ncbi:hypothetical protein [Actinocorallia longicatena]|uniref:hypothetical protein n=1 Tax=Actinocorallia longicatena TaxID=111803 RepID=UPI0031D0C63B